MLPKTRNRKPRQGLQHEQRKEEEEKVKEKGNAKEKKKEKEKEKGNEKEKAFVPTASSTPAEVMSFLQSFSHEFDWSIFAGVRGSHLVKYTEQQLIGIMPEAKGLAIALYNELHPEQTSKIFFLRAHIHTHIKIYIYRGTYISLKSLV